MPCQKLGAPFNAIVCTRKPPVAVNRSRRTPKRAATRAPIVGQQLPLTLDTPLARPRAHEAREPFTTQTPPEATMHYTIDDYNRATIALRAVSSKGPTLAPSERRTLEQARRAFIIDADVPQSEVKLARAIIGAATLAAPASVITQG